MYKLIFDTLTRAPEHTFISSQMTIRHSQTSSRGKPRIAIPQEPLPLRIGITIWQAASLTCGREAAGRVFSGTTLPFSSDGLPSIISQILSNTLHSKFLPRERTF